MANVLYCDKYQCIQIFTVDQLLGGATPHIALVDLSIFKNAAEKAANQQHDLLL
ncbi:MAG: hypothetical protein IIA73_00910 [Proteobacteria bacterium]|nr:hypothetical protein [Pseudomonadota bacterium]